ncbi:MAG: CHAT domain-containing protein [Bacteroidales bacterium]|nr:CHAT domain-containing protein [Bacteroidales bacterium]
MRASVYFKLSFVLFILLNLVRYSAFSAEQDTIALTHVNVLLKNAQFDKAYILLDSLESVYKEQNETSFLAYTHIRRAQLAYRKREIKDGFFWINKAKDLCETLSTPDSIIFADIEHVLGMHYYSIGEHEKALVYCEHALRLKSWSYNRLSVPISYTYNMIATISLSLKDYLTANSNYELAKYSAIHNEGVSSDDLDISSYYMNLGIVHGQMGNYEMAEENFRKGLEIYEKKGAKKSKFASTYLNFGRLFADREINDSALYYYGKAEDAYIQAYGSDCNRLAGVYMNMGTIFIKISDNESALLYYEKALSMYQLFLSPDHDLIHMVLMNIGFAYEVKDDFEKAFPYYFKATENRGFVGVRACRNIANCYSAIGNYKLAEKYFKESIQRCLVAKEDKNEELAMTYMHYGDLLINKEVDRDRGFENLRKADSIFMQEYNPNKRDYAMINYYIGDFYLMNKELDKALEAYQKALIIIGEGYTSKDVLSVPNDSVLYLDNIQLNALKRKAFCLFTYYSETGNLEYLQASYKTYRTTINFIAELQSSMYHEESKLYFTDRLNDVFDRGIVALDEWYRITKDDRVLEQAFEFAEKGKSSVLLSAIKEVEAMQVSKIPPELQKVELQNRNDISFYNKMIYSESQIELPDTNKVALWKDVIFQTKRSHDSLIMKIEQEYPDYYNLKIDKSVLGVRAIQKKLETNEVLLEYILTDSIIYAFVITKDDRQLVSTLYQDTIFAANIKEVRDCLIANEFTNYSNKDYKAFVSSSYYLYQNLIQPVEKYIEGKKLIIVPDGMLGYIPFEILLTSYPNPKYFSYKELDYLINKCAISYTYSATLLFKGSNKKDRATKNLLAFAPSYSDIKGNDTIVNERSATAEHLFPIPGVKEEVSYINEVYDGDVFFDDLASEKLFKDLAKDYNVLHLAMHTLIDDQNPLYSNLVFADNKEGGQDCLLNAYELFNMELKADMAVLSACNTGFGHLHGGEGIMSLARGFLYAGVNSIIMTLWAVEDHSSASLMKIFYKNLSEGMDKDIALQQAKIVYIQQSHQLGAHPHYWAGYVNIGDTNPLYKVLETEDYILYGSFTSLLLLIGGGLFGWRYSRKKKK